MKINTRMAYLYFKVWRYRMNLCYGRWLICKFNKQADFQQEMELFRQYITAIDSVLILEKMLLGLDYQGVRNEKCIQESKCSV